MLRLDRLTEGSQTEHLVELPLLGVPDEVSRVRVLLGAMEHGPPEVGLAQQAEHAQLPVDLHEDKEERAAEDGGALVWYQLVLLTFSLVLNSTCRKAWALQRMASIRMMTRSYSMYLSTGFLHESCQQMAQLLTNMLV